MCAAHFASDDPLPFAAMPGRSTGCKAVWLLIDFISAIGTCDLRKDTGVYMNRGIRFFSKSLGGSNSPSKNLALKRIASTVSLLAVAMLFWGAGLADGVAFFEKGNYRDARQVLGKTVAEAPDDPKAHFYLGRTFLALEEAVSALPHFEKAIQLDPDKAAYYFWLGVTHWALLDLDRELAAYDQALAIDSQFLPAHVYAGHNQLDRGQWEAALGHYVTVLQALPEHPEALYNAGIALEAMDRKAEAIAVWQRYLEHHRSGRLADDAVRNLNLLGAFAYKRFAIGQRFVVGPSPGFAAGSLTMDPQLSEVLDQIGQLITANANLMLHIVTYVANDEDLAKQRAKAVKQVMRDHFPEISLERVRVSWFGQAEPLKVDDNTYHLRESLNLFSAQTENDAP